MKRRRTEIIIETDEVLVVRPRRAAPRGWCGACRSEVEMLTPEAAALSARLSARGLYRLVESGAVHFFETPVGGLLICARSIPAP